METKKILIVDDDVDVINVLKPYLVNQKFEVESALNKQEGLEKAKQFKPDLIILDVMMMSPFEGFEMKDALSNDPELKNIPVIINTSIDVFTTSKSDVQAMAREFRGNPDYKELQVLLVKDSATGSAGIDYLAEDGKTHWLPVNGFIKKPVEPDKMIEEIKALLY